MYKMLIFDFDGTLADTYSIVNSVYRELLKKYDFPRLSNEDIESMRNVSTKEIIKSFNISFWRLPMILRKATPLYRKLLPDSELYPGIQALLKALSLEGYQLGILSSSDDTLIKQYFKTKNLMVFDFIAGGSPLFKKHRKLKQIIKSQKMLRKDVLYIGDEVRDIEACKKVGIDVVAVTWGYNSADVLSKHSPDYLVNDIQTLQKIIRQKTPSN